MLVYFFRAVFRDAEQAELHVGKLLRDRAHAGVDPPFVERHRDLGVDFFAALPDRKRITARDAFRQRDALVCFELQTECSEDCADALFEFPFEKQKRAGNQPPRCEERLPALWLFHSDCSRRNGRVSF